MGIYGPAGEVPGLLSAAGEGDAAAWEGLWAQLHHQGTTCAAGVAALPELALLSGRADRAVAARAVELAGEIVGAAVWQGQAIPEPAEFREARAVLAREADRLLAARPDGYVSCFRAKLALDGFIVLSDLFDGFADLCFEVGCPRCSERVSVVIGEFGRYSSIRDWDLGDVNPIPLHPADPDGLTDAEKGLLAAAVRDERPELVQGLSHLFGRAECGACGGHFSAGAALEAKRRK